MENEDELDKDVRERIEREAAGKAPAPDAPPITGKYIQDCLLSNSLGDGTLFATLMQGKFLFIKNFQEWYEWTGHCWQRDVMGGALAAVEDVVQQYLGEYKRLSLEIVEMTAAGSTPESDGIKKIRTMQTNLLQRISQLRGDNRRTACLKFAHTNKRPLAISGDQMDAKPWLFPCANGVINLQKGTLRPGVQSDYLSLCSPVEFLGLEHPAPLWDETLLGIFDGNIELVEYLQRLLGYGLTGIVNEKIFPVFHGKTGWNGRTLLVETINFVMGKLAGSIPAEMLLSQRFVKSSSGPSPDIMSLKGIRLAFASEIDEGQRFSASMIKKLTGNDELVGRSPHDKYPTRFAPTHKLIVMTNTQPAAPAHDQAFWERLQLIPFEISFVNRDPQEPHERRANLNLGREILKEASGILAWLVRGCLLWQIHGINPPLCIKEASKLYQRNEDMMADFVDECVAREQAARERAADLYACFVKWYHENIGPKEPSGTWFGKTIRAKFEKIKSNGVVYYVGCRIKAEQGGTEG